MRPSLSSSDDRVIIHFDYDCFYASVVENENPALKAVPLAIQQKQIVVTCNYEARRRGLRKLQLITDAKRICPEAVIILGEDLTRFRNASKELYNFLKESIWNRRAERLGFDEVWLDCTDMIEYNVALLNHNDLAHSYFCLDRDDPTNGFGFNASQIFGPTYPAAADACTDRHLRLSLGSHLARHLRHELESQKGYTATVGVATNKLLSKLVGNVHKPKNQTTLLPVPSTSAPNESSVTVFMDSHDIGKVPGIGFKIAQRIRARVLGRVPNFDEGLVYGGTKEIVSVRDARLYNGMGPEMLEEVLGGPGSQKGIGGKVWGLINGIDETEVAKAKRVPSQISQEDSYMKYLRTFEDVRGQLQLLGRRLVERMQIDLMEADDLEEVKVRRWLAHPRTLRLTTRPRPPLNADGTRSRTFQRISRSGPLPTFVFNLNENIQSIADRLVDESLVPMFRKLHPEKTGWNLSLINIAVTNMTETAAESKDSEGRDIGRMFKRQDDVLRDFKIAGDGDLLAEVMTEASPEDYKGLSEQTLAEGSFLEDRSMSEDENESDFQTCQICQAALPAFAMSAHGRYHDIDG